MEPWFETAFAGHYPVLYGHRSPEEAAACLELLNRLVPLPTADPVLDLGCGQGRHLAWLRDQGVAAFGLDLSRDLLGQARRDHGPGLSLVRGDMRHLPLGDGSFGAVLSLFTAFGYFGELADNLGMVRQVVRVLRPGGLWYLDYLDCVAVRRELSGQPPLTRERHLGPLAVTETRRLAPGERQVIKLVEIRPQPGRQEQAAALGVAEAGLNYEEKVALFDRSELLEMAHDAGLELAKGVGSYNGAPLDQGNRWILIFRRREAGS